MSKPDFVIIIYPSDCDLIASSDSVLHRRAVFLKQMANINIRDSFTIPAGHNESEKEFKVEYSGHVIQDSNYQDRLFGIKSLISHLVETDFKLLAEKHHYPKILNDVVWREVLDAIKLKYEDISFFCILDGHGGQKTVDFIVTFGYVLLAQYLSKFDESTDFGAYLSLFTTFIHETYKQVLLSDPEVVNYHDGSTCVFLLIDHKSTTVYTASVGDSLVMLNNIQQIAHSCDNIDTNLEKSFKENNTLYGTMYAYTYDLEAARNRTRIGIGGYRMYHSIGDYAEDMDVFNALQNYQSGNKESYPLIHKFMNLKDPDRFCKFPNDHLMGRKPNVMLRNIKRNMMGSSAKVMKMGLGETKWVSLASDGYSFYSIDDHRRTFHKDGPLSSESEDDRSIFTVHIEEGMKAKKKAKSE